MKKGDLLFGKRRAYQRKVAIAPFDGIFSAHGMVLRPKEDVIDRNFFPFLIASDAFIAEAIRISVGGLSPTINWKDLKQLEFSLPTLAEQKKLAETLWAMERVKRAYKSLLAQTDALAQARFVEMFGDGRDDKPLGTLCRIGSGKRVFASEFKEEGVPFYRGTEINQLSLRTFEKPTLYICESHYRELAKATGVPVKGDILMASINPDGLNWIVDTDDPFYIKDGRVLWIHPGKNLDSHFLSYALSKSISDNYHLVASGTTFAEMKIVTLKQLPIPLPPLALQREFAAFIAQQEKAKASLKESLAALTAAQKSLMNSSFAKVTEDKGGEKE